MFILNDRWRHRAAQPSLAQDQSVHPRLTEHSNPAPRCYYKTTGITSYKLYAILLIYLYINKYFYLQDYCIYIK